LRDARGREAKINNAGAADDDDDDDERVNKLSYSIEGSTENRESS
jgi:hypothetical protein